MNSKTSFGNKSDRSLMVEINNPEMELIITEENYVDNLRVLIDTFVNPIGKWIKMVLDRHDKTKILPEYCVEAIASEEENLVDYLFSNIKPIFDFHVSFLEDIKQDTNDRLNKIATCFERYAPFFRMYSQFITNFDRAHLLLNRLKLDPR